MYPQTSRFAIRALRAGRHRLRPFSGACLNTVTTSGAEAGTLEAIETSETSTPPVPSAADELPGFDALGLSDVILRAVTDSGYTKPPPIQAKTIPLALQ